MATATKPKPASPAEVPAETAAAHQTEYDPAVPIDWIHPHPNNPRHDATADDELVESIREQGLIEHLVVIPNPNETQGGFLLIAGHRRLDGLRRAGFTAAPATVRFDLTDEADQVAAMLVENGRRRDFTPIEEAEGYGQLRFDFGWKPGQIAKKAGHSVDTINRRLKLLKLDDKVKTRVDGGQLNIDDAIAIAEMPAAEQKQLAKAAGGPNFKWELSRAQERTRKNAATKAAAEKLDKAGTPFVNMPKGAHVYSLNHADHGMTRLGATFSHDPEQHKGCLAYTLTKDYSGADEVVLVCTDVPAHDEQLDADRAARQAKVDQEQAERKARHEGEKLASQLRIDSVRSLIRPGVKVDPGLADVLRVTLPALLRTLEEVGFSHKQYQESLGITDRWDNTYSSQGDDIDAFRKHFDGLDTGYKLLNALVTMLAVITDVEPYVYDPGTWDTQVVLPQYLAWLDLTEKAGHQPTPFDTERRDRATAAIDQADNTGEA